MKKMMILLGMSIALAGFAAEKNTPNIISSAVMKNAPVIDGVINADEWKDAAEVFGSRIYGTRILEPRVCRFFIGRDAKNLYFAAQSELPPEKIKLLAKAKKRDAPVYRDDAVELIVMPPHGKGVYHTIVNSIGSIFDKWYKMENGGITTSKPLEWNPKTKTASTISNGKWNVEIAIPLSDLNVAKTVKPEKWRIQMTRDWKQPAVWTSWSKTRNFCAPENMGLLRIAPSGPVTKFSGLGKNFRKGDVNCFMTILNPGASTLKLHCRMDITSITAPRSLDTLKEVPAGGAAEFALNFSDATKAKYECRMKITDTTNQIQIFNDAVDWEPAKGSKWRSSDAKKASLDFAFYPYKKLVKARINLVGKSKKSSIGSVLFKVTAPNGKNVAEKRLSPKSEDKSIETLITLSEMPEGEYTLTAETFSSQGSKLARFSRKFKYKRFPWEHNKIGLDDVIIPPFKPLRWEESTRTLSALMTSYRTQNGFWDAIFAKGENILSAPVEFVVNGGVVKFKEKSFKTLSVKDSGVITETVMESPTIRMRLTHKYDYDGMCKLEMELSPIGEADINSAYLAIPLKNGVAKLMHTVNNNLRYNFADYIPKGSGVVWESRMAKKQPKVAGSFMPYFWMGDVYKGLSWFTASDKDWSVDRDKPALEVVRFPNAVELRVNIANKPFKLNKPLKFVMGFQATPVKPRMKGWRMLSERWKPKKIPGALKMVNFAGPGTYGCAKEGDFAPVDGDYTVVELTKRENRGKTLKESLKPLKGFMERNFKNVSPREYDFVKRHVERGVRFSKNCDYSIAYVNSRASSLAMPAYQTHMDEWWCSEYRANMEGGYNNTYSPSNLDCRLYYVEKLVQAGMDGIYYDNIRDWFVFDPVRGPAYKLPDGTIQPYCDIFELRKLAKRTATMLYMNKKTFPDGRPVFEAHMTNTNLVPVLSFVTIQLDMEAWYGASDFQTRFSEGYILSDSLGTQSGCVPEVLCKISGNDKARVSRTFVATALAFDLPIVMNCGGLSGRLWTTIKKTIMKFGYGTEKVDVYPCWREQNFVTTTTSKIKLAVYKKKNTAIIAVSDFGHAGKVVVDIAGLKFANPAVVNMESGKSILVENGKLTLDISKHDFRLLKIARGE